MTSVGDRRRLRADKTRWFWRGRHVVYRCYSGTKLLYVGASSDVVERLAQHRRSTPWWPEVDRTVVRLFPDRMAAFAAELAAIRAESPAFNVRHTPRWAEPRQKAA